MLSTVCGSKKCNTLTTTKSLDDPHLRGNIKPACDELIHKYFLSSSKAGDTLMGREKNIKGNLSGGSATAGGINFQAAVTAITEIHLASGTPLSWLDGITNDVPIAVLAESGGAGDDIRIQLRDGSHVEVQIKRNLTADKRLWKPLLDLAEALQNDEKLFGLLIVSPNSSGTVRDDLAQDIRRMGGGRYDGIKALAQRFKNELEQSEFSVQNVCSRLRIVTVYASGSDIGCISRAQFLLRGICADSDQVVAAWDHLQRDSTLLIVDVH